MIIETKLDICHAWTIKNKYTICDKNLSINELTISTTMSSERIKAVGLILLFVVLMVVNSSEGKILFVDVNSQHGMMSTCVRHMFCHRRDCI